MRHDWVLDVLDDLIAYARQNDLPGLAEGAAALRDASEAEMAVRAGEAPVLDAADALAGHGDQPF